MAPSLSLGFSVGGASLCLLRLQAPFARNSLPIRRASRAVQFSALASQDSISFYIYKMRRVNIGEIQKRLCGTATAATLINEPLPGGTTSLLHSIVEQREAGLVAALLPAALQAGADVSATDSQGCTALHYAANNTDAQACATAVRLLLEAGADPGARSLGGVTPLHTAARNMCAEAAGTAVQLLVAAGAPVDAELDDSAGSSSPLHFALAANDSPAAMEAVVAGLLAGGADVNAQARSGSQPLHLAASRASNGVPTAAAIRLLLEAGAAPNALDAAGRGPLHLAVGAPPSALAAVQALLSGGADPNLPCSGGCWRPMHAAAQLPNGQAASANIAALVAGGGDVAATDSAGETALHYAASNSHAPTATGQTTSGSKARGAGAVIAAALLTAGAPANHRSGAGMQPLHCCAERSTHNSAAADIVAVLVTGGAELDALNAARLTPLALAARNQTAAGPAVVQALVEAGASMRPLLNLL